MRNLKKNCMLGIVAVATAALTSGCSLGRLPLIIGENRTMYGPPEVLERRTDDRRDETDESFEDFGNGFDVSESSEAPDSGPTRTA